MKILIIFYYINICFGNINYNLRYIQNRNDNIYKLINDNSYSYNFYSENSIKLSLINDHSYSYSEPSIKPTILSTFVPTLINDHSYSYTELSIKPTILPTLINDLNYSYNFYSEPSIKPTILSTLINYDNYSYIFYTEASIKPTFSPTLIKQNEESSSPQKLEPSNYILIFKLLLTINNLDMNNFKDKDKIILINSLSSILNIDKDDLEIINNNRKLQIKINNIFIINIMIKSRIPNKFSFEPLLYYKNLKNLLLNSTNNNLLINNIKYYSKIYNSTTLLNTIISIQVEEPIFLYDDIYNQTYNQTVLPIEEIKSNNLIYLLILLIFVPIICIKIYDNYTINKIKENDIIYTKI